MTWRRALVWLLAAGAAVLSFDALRAFALGAPPLAGGVIPTRTVVDREWLAALWAVEIDAMAAAGILGARQDRKDWRAWAMFLLAAVASVGFQVFTLPAILARAVPPVALFLAIVVLELPRTTARPAWEEPVVPLVPSQPDPADDPADQPEPEVVRLNSRRPNTTTLDKAEVAVRLGKGQSGLAIARDLGLSERRYKAELLPLIRRLRDQPVRVGPNGQEPGGGS